MTISLHSMIAQELYNQGELPKKYEDLVPKMPDPVWKWVEVTTNEVRTSGLVYPGQVYILQKFIGDAKSDYQIDWQEDIFMRIRVNNSSYRKRSGSLPVPSRYSSPDYYSVVGILNYNTKVIYFYRENTGGFGVPEGGYSSGTSAASKLEIVDLYYFAAAQNTRAIGGGRDNWHTPNQSKYPFRSGTSRFIAYNWSDSAGNFLLDDIVIKVGSNILFKGANISI